MNGWALAFVLATQALPKQDAVELRPRITFSGTAELSPRARVHADLLVEGLAADRPHTGGRVRDVAADARDAWVEVGGTRADLRAGFGRLSWGRLDEIQPSDVINPIDTARFLLEGRAEARRPVAFTRARWFVTSATTLEGVVVPFFRRSTFDSLDERTSPFNLVTATPRPPNVVITGLTRATPPRDWSSVQGGGRVSSTVGRVDYSASVYRGVDGFGDIAFVPDALQAGGAIVGHLLERYRPFTMVAGDFETVTGAWAWRGEAAWKRDRSFDAGVGFDRKTGEFRVFGSAIVQRRRRDRNSFPAEPLPEKSLDLFRWSTDVSLVGSIERSFSRDRWLARAFAVVNPHDASGFLRGLVSWRVSDHVACEASGAAFLGSGDDDISRFSGRDFVLARVRWYVK